MHTETVRMYQVLPINGHSTNTQQRSNFTPRETEQREVLQLLFVDFKSRPPKAYACCRQLICCLGLTLQRSVKTTHIPPTICRYLGGNPPTPRYSCSTLPILELNAVDHINFCIQLWHIPTAKV